MQLVNFLLNDERSNVVFTVVIVLVVSPIAVWKFLGFPAATEDLLVTNLFQVHSVHYFGSVLLDGSIYLPRSGPFSLQLNGHIDAVGKCRGSCDPWYDLGARDAMH